MTPIVAAILAGAGLVVLVVVLVIVKQSWRSVAPGRVLVINKTRGTQVSFTGAMVLPIVHRAEEMDISVKQIVIDRRGKDGVICADNLRADTTVTFFVRVNKTADDIERVAQSVGCARASDPRTLEELFSAKFSEAIKTVAKQLEFEELFTKREVFKDQIIMVIGRDLNGFVLDDVAVDYLEQTGIEHLDPGNVLDAQGIRKIRSLASVADREPPRPDLATDLERHGLLDIRITTEVSCDVSSERAALAVTNDGSDSVLGKLPSGITRTLLDAVGSGELVCKDGRATFRWTGLDVDRGQLLAGARLVRAFREDDQAYR